MGSHWFKHPRIWLTIGVVGLIVTLINWVEDRDPPTLIGTQYFVPSAPAGGTLIVKMHVQRNLGRACSLGSSRSFVGANHSWSLIVPYEFASAEGRARREEEEPNVLTMNIRIPNEAPVGPAQIVTENRYTCTWNPTTWLLPIDTSWTAYINVEEPAPK